jgi:uncharacterized protein (DUF362 family)
MTRISRRELLKIAGLGASGLLLQQVLSACGIKPTVEGVTPSDSPTPSAPPTPTVVKATATPYNGPDLVVVRDGEPEQLVRKALEALGGMGRFVAAGAKVVVKPNICISYNSYEYASTTNPWVVGALVKLCMEAGASSVKVLDYPFSGESEQAYRMSGIQEQVEAAGGQMEVISHLKFVPVDNPEAVILKNLKAYQEALDADVLINVPIAKHHSLAGLTLGMKNLMGLVSSRESLHSALGDCLPDLVQLFKPALTVVDAVRILTAGGPTGGNLKDVKKLDTIIASPDIVAADSYATSLFGLTPADISYVKGAIERGIGRGDLENLKIGEYSLKA